MLFVFVLFLNNLIFNHHVGFPAIAAINSTYSFVASPDTLLKTADTSLYDTVYVKKEPVYFKKEIFVEDSSKFLFHSAGIWFSPNYYNFGFSPVNQENESYNKITANSQKSNPGFTIGASYILYFKNWLAEIGISYTRFNGTFNYKVPLYKADTTFRTVIDTLDSYYIVNGNNTSWVYVTQSRKLTVIDSIDISKTFNANNSYNYFEFPVMLGYEHFMGKFSITAKAGIISGILLNAKWQSVSLSDFKETTEMSSFFRNINLSGIVSANLSYDFNDRLRIYTEPFYRRNLTNTFNNAFPLQLYTNTFGVKIGVIFNWL